MSNGVIQSSVAFSTTTTVISLSDNFFTNLLTEALTVLVVILPELSMNNEILDPFGTLSILQRSYQSEAYVSSPLSLLTNIGPNVLSVFLEPI